MRDKQLAPVLARLEQGYLAAGESLMRDPSSQAPIVAKAFQQAFQSIGAPQPMPGVLIRAIASGDLVFGPGPGLGAVRAGTISWLERVLDHRIAMSFAVAGLRTPGVVIADESCVQKSFPTFWEVFQELYR